MKNRLFIALFLLIPLARVAAQSIITIDTLPQKGFVLDKNWKWHAGDNPAWADPEFDDSGWSDVNPTDDVGNIPQLTQKKGRK